MGDGDVALPAGTVTFLLTDIEGSTRLWQERPVEMPATIARHRELLDEAIARHHGVRPVEQGEGDSVVGAFERASDALAAALHAQVALGEEVPLLSVRMALHTDEAHLRDEGNYDGLGIIRAARLRGCGHGGQVLVSETTALLVANHLPESTSLLDLGTARLRDLSRAERVYQLCHPRLRSAFPPLRSLDAAPQNLPVPLTSLIGREQERATIAQLLREHRLVTLTGAGGSGKSRLALHAAADGVAEHPGGTWWVELAPANEAAQVAERTAQAAGLMLPPGSDAVTALSRSLKDEGEVLFVLDNAEHVVDAVAYLVDALLAGAPNVRVLVTSREPLGVPGEVIWRVPSLAAPSVGAEMALERLAAYEAVQLFLERARQARPNLALDGTSAPHVTAICARLDGLPLALELAAARARTLPLDRLAAGLDDAFRLLTGGARTVSARQQTLWASIAWSVDLLDAEEQAVLRRVAVFSAPFTLDAAEVVAAGGSVEPFAVLPVLGRLVDKSLVQLDDSTGRYGLLATVRQFGLERLRADGELASTRDCFTEWYARWSEEVHRGVHGLAVEPLLPEVPNLLGALDWAYETSPEHVHRILVGLCDELWILGPSAGGRLIDWVLARDPDRDDRWAASILALGYVAWFYGRPDLAACFAAAEARLGPDEDEARRRVLSRAAMSDSFRGRHDNLERLLEDAMARADERDIVRLAGDLAFFEARCGRLARSGELVKLVEDITARRGASFNAHTAKFAYPAALDRLVLLGRLPDALAMARSSAAARYEYSLSPVVAHAQAGYLSGADEVLDEAMRVAAVNASPIAVVQQAELRAYAAARAGDWRRAADESWANWMNQLEMGMGDIRGMRTPFTLTCQLAAGEAERAASLVTMWRAEIEDYGDAPLLRAAAKWCEALLAASEGRLDDAAGDGHAFLGIAHRSGLVLYVIDALGLLAELAARRRLDLAAARLAAAAASARRQIGYQRPIAVDPAAPDLLAARLEVEQPEAFAEGAALELDDAVAYAQRSRGERGRPASGWSSLTPTEQQVAGLVAAGRTNADIAEQLLMRPATVKTHLTHIFTKLALANRTELAAAYHQDRTR